MRGLATAGAVVERRSIRLESTLGRLIPSRHHRVRAHLATLPSPAMRAVERHSRLMSHSHGTPRSRVLNWSGSGVLRHRPWHRGRL
jgi:hypothetical protein